MTIVWSAAICDSKPTLKGEALCEMDSSGCPVFARCC